MTLVKQSRRRRAQPREATIREAKRSKVTQEKPGNDWRSTHWLSDAGMAMLSGSWSSKIKAGKMEKQYSWSFKGQHFDIDPNVAAEEFEKIRTNYGYLKPDTLVEAARDESHPLHSVFPWNDEEAARIGRAHIASYLIRSLRVTVEVVPGQIVKVRGAVLTRDIYAPNEKSYRDVIETMKEPEGRAFVLRQAWLQLAAWKRKYAGLSELSGALPLIDEVLKKISF